MNRRTLKTELKGLGIGILIFLAGMLCLTMNQQTGFSSVVWLPTGIEFATLFLFGLEFWPWILIGEIALCTGAHFRLPVILMVPASVTAIQFLFARYLRNRLGSKVTFARLQDLLLYFVLACVAMPLCLSLVASSVHTLLGTIPADRFFLTWRAWVCGEGMGMLVLGTFLINFKNDAVHRKPLLKKRGWEGLVFFSFVLAINIFIFTPLSRYNHTLLIKPYFLFSIMLIVSLRFDLLGSTIASLIIAGTSLAGGLCGFVAFASTVSDQTDRMLMLQFMIAAITVTGGVVAATVREKSEALDARNEFLDIASHELKTPITSLKLQLQLLQRRLNQNPDLTEAEAEQLVFLKKVDRQVIRLVKIVEQLLDVSRAERNLMQLDREELVLNDMIQNLADRLSGDIVNAKCSLQIDLPKELKGYWDPFRMEQVLENLLSNAIKYAPGALIEVIATNKGDSLELTVKDKGPGIPAEKQHTIFDRFVRASETRYVQGLGLGLFITRRIVEAHGGSIKVKSSRGEGTAFTVTLPFKSIP